MKRRMLSLLLCALLALGLCVPAAAAGETLDQELQRVTLQVKKTLSIADTYTTFSGNPQDLGVMRYWQLDWSSEDGSSVSVMADSTGKILRYNVSVPETQTVPSGGYAPTLSKLSGQQARKTAEAFLSAVLTGQEKGVLSESAGSVVPVSGSCSFSAEILLSGVPSDITAQLTVDDGTGAVSSYYRSDFYSAYVNDLPSAVPAVSAAAAAKALAEPVSLEAQYVLSSDGTAAVRYVPTVNAALYVDAQTGKLTDLNEAWANISYRGGGVAENTAAAADASSGTADKTALTEAEQATIAKLQGVLSKDALDAAARKVTALGLSAYTLSGADFSLDADSGQVSCTLRYTRALAFSELTGVDRSAFKDGLYRQTKVLTLDGRTGALLSGWSYRPWCMKDGTLTRTALTAAANGFLKSWQPERAAQTALTQGSDESFSYDRKVNGYFYHGNSVQVGMDTTDGSVDSFYLNWDDELTFRSPGTVISAAAAKAALCSAYQATLRYIAYPVSVDVSLPIWETYASCCGSVAYRHVLGYTYEIQGAPVEGVDAQTGALIRTESVSADKAYTDISGSFAKTQIEALAAAGIRFGGSEQFQPSAKLTQKEMLVLLLNSCGWDYDAEDLSDEAVLESVYSAAWSQGFLTRGVKDPDHAVTRMELVRAILSASPYGPATKLAGIYKTTFRDAASFVAADVSYAALAEGLGLVKGDAAHRFLPSRIVTRQEAAAILYNYMNR